MTQVPDVVRFDQDLTPQDRARVTSSLARLELPSDFDEVRIARLPGGASNNNYRVAAIQRTAVLRVAAPDAGRFGIDRGAGLAAHRLVAAAGIAPDLIAEHLPSGDCLTPFLPGRTVDAELLGQPGVLNACIDLLRRTHATRSADLAGCGRFSGSRDIRAYVDTARSEGLELPSDIDAMVEASIRVDPVGMPFGARLAHNDVQLANFLCDDSGRMWLLDWEYAGVGNVYFDLAMLASNADMSAEQREDLLAAYFAPAGPVRECDRHRLRAMVFLSALREAMWSVVAGPVMADTGWDYHAWAQRFFEKVRDELTRHGADGLARDAGHAKDDDRVAALLFGE